MKFNTISNTASLDRQLISIGIDLKSIILEQENYIHDEYFAKIYKIAQEWDRVFQNSLSPRKGVSS